MVGRHWDKLSLGGRTDYEKAGVNKESATFSSRTAESSTHSFMKRVTSWKILMLRVGYSDAGICSSKEGIILERERLAVPAQLYPSDQIHSSRGHISMETNLTINLWNNLHLERWGCGMGLRKMRHIFWRKQQGYFLIGNNIPQIRIPSILQASITCNWWSISSSLAWIRLNKSSVVYCNKGKKRRK